jgi:uncharacterized PurR-regulated membrane protein YhhQ (DUF165 family)
MLYLAIGIYATAMTLANLSVAAFGPAISPINAFLFIGLDLALRDWLHVRLKLWQMGALIAASGILTFLLNPASGKIAIASAAAFSVAALVDWLVFTKAKGSWFMRANQSNVAGAAVDSLVFPTIAFGALMPGIVLLQFVAKVFGGFVWAYIVEKLNRKQLVLIGD